MLARQLASAMKAQSLTKTEIARDEDHPAALDRLLDPANESLTLETLEWISAAVDRRVKL